jgi:hypothetical protein
MRIHPRAVLVSAAFWGTLLLARDVRWGIAAAVAAGLIDWAAIVLPFLPRATSPRRES